MKKSVSNSESMKAIAATCPAGKKVIGGGALVFDWGYPEVTILASYPTETGWNALAEDAVPAPQAWDLRAYAICAKVAA